MLSIAIHDNDHITSRSFQASAKSQLLPKVPAQAQAAQNG
jgi:hypothetical protein